MAEAETWLTLERIGLSRFVEFALFDNRPFWAERDPTMFMENALRAFALGRCYDLAAASALASGLPVAVIRRAGEHGPAILHAVVYDPATQAGFDILGPRPFAVITRELRDAAGRVSISLQQPDEEDADEDARAIAAGLPWMPRSPASAITPFARLVEIVEGLHAEPGH